MIFRAHNTAETCEGKINLLNTQIKTSNLFFRNGNKSGGPIVLSKETFCLKFSYIFQIALTFYNLLNYSTTSAKLQKHSTIHSGGSHYLRDPPVLMTFWVIF